MSSIGFTNEGTIDLERLRARLQKMSDEELLQFGKGRQVHVLAVR